MEAIKRLPDGELAVMQAVWDCEIPCTRHDAAAKLAHPMAETTLLTQLSRLTEKGYLAARKEGRITKYTPLITREDYLARQSHRFLHQLCGGSLSTLASALCSSGLTEEELAQLRDLLDRGGL